MPSLKFLLHYPQPHCTLALMWRPRYAATEAGGDIFHQLQMIHYRNLLPQFHTHKHMPIIVSSTNRKALVHDTTTVMHSYRIFNIKSSSITLNFVVSTA